MKYIAGLLLLLAVISPLHITAEVSSILLRLRQQLNVLYLLVVSIYLRIS